MRLSGGGGEKIYVRADWGESSRTLLRNISSRGARGTFRVRGKGPGVK